MATLPSVFHDDPDYERTMAESYGFSPSYARVVTERQKVGLTCGCAQSFGPCEPCRRELRDAEKAAALERLAMRGALA